MSCELCQRAESIRQGTYPYLVHEFEHSWWLLGEHQYYRGYSVLLLKHHHRELTELAEATALAAFQELWQTQRAVEQVFRPHKMNLCSLGNVVDHVHWHLFPRYLDDPHRTNPPWLQMQDFATKKIDAKQAQQIILDLKAHLPWINS